MPLGSHGGKSKKNIPVVDIPGIYILRTKRGSMNQGSK